MDKLNYSVMKTYFKVKNSLEKFKSEEDGMETLEVVILIVVAVMVAGLLLDFLQGDDGILQHIFETIREKFDTLFGE